MQIAISTKNFSGHTGSSRIIGELSRGFISHGHNVDIIGNTLNKKAVITCGANPVEIKKFWFAKKLARRDYMEKHLNYVRKSGHSLYIGNGDEARQDILILHNCVNLCHEIVNGASVGDAAIRDVSGIHRHILKNRLFSKMIANSQLMKNDISKRYGVAPELINVIHPAYDSNIFTAENRAQARAEFMEEMDIPAESEFLVGQVMSGDFTKRNVRGFFNIINMLPEELAKKIHLVVVGKDKLDNFVEKRPQNLTFIEYSASPASIMRSLDLMLYPALLEEFGLVVAEALACGTPVLSSRMVGATELFSGLHAESLCDKPDEKHFAAHLARFIADESYRQALQAESAGMVKKLSWQSYFNAFNNIVTELRAA